MQRFSKQSQAFLKALSDGQTPAEAASSAGATLWTFQRWRALGHPTTARPGIDDHFIEFARQWGALRDRPARDRH